LYFDDNPFFVDVTWSSVAPPHQPSGAWKSELHALIQAAFKGTTAAICYVHLILQDL
jgi:hypothetical protein